MSSPQAITEVLDRYLAHAMAEGPGEVDHFLEQHADLDGAARDQVRALARSLSGGSPPASWSSLSTAARLPRERLGGFRLLRPIGGGGMGMVYLAEQEPIHRLVALKVLRPELSASPEARALLLDEARAVARLRHPNIVTVFAAGEEDGTLYMAMELVPGHSLDEHLSEWQARGERPAASQLVRWGAEIARALAAAHRSGLMHRDVKPSNIRITPEGKAVLLDFGLARDVEGSARSATGQFQGSPYYASPEQVRGRSADIDPRTDVYSLGTTLYECLTGRVPFEGTTPEVVFQQILAREPPSPRRFDPSLSRELEAVLLKAMSKDPGERYPSAEAFADDLQALLEMRPVSARPAHAGKRLVKWARRHPALASAVGIAATAILALPVAVILTQQAALADVKEERDQKELAFTEADSLRLATQSTLLLPRNPGTALLLAIESAERRLDSTSNSALFHALAGCREERTLQGHDLGLREALFLESGSNLVTNSMDGTVRWWDLRSGSQSQVLFSNPSRGNDLDLAQDGARLAASFGDGSVVMVDLLTRASQELLPRHAASALQVDFDSSGKRLLSYSLEGTARVWDCMAREMLLELGPDRELRVVQLRPDGKAVAAGFGDGRLELRRVDDGELIMEAPAHGDRIVQMAFAPDGKLLATASRSGAVRLWDGLTGAALDRLEGHPGLVFRLAFRPDGRQLASCLHAPGQVRLWDTTSGELADEIVFQGSLTALEYSPDGRTLAASSTDGAISVWRLGPRGSVMRLEGHASTVYSFSFSPGGERLCSASEDRTARVWSLRDPVLRRLLGPESAPRAFSLDAERRRVACLEAGGLLVVLDLEDGRVVEERSLGDRPASSVTILPGGDQVAVSCLDPRGKDYSISIWDLAGGAELRSWQREPVKSNTLEVHPGQPWLLAKDAVTVGAVWNWKTGERVAEYRLPSDNLHYLRLSPSGDRVLGYATGGEEIGVFDTASGEIVAIHGSLPNKVLRAAWLEDRTLAWCGDQGIFQVLAADSGAVVFEREFQRGPILELHSLDGSSKLALEGRGWITLVDADDPPAMDEFRGGHGDVLSISLNRSGELLAASYADRSLRIWRASDQEELLSLQGTPRPIAFLKADPSSDGFLLGCSREFLSVLQLQDYLALAKQRAPRELTDLEREQYRLLPRER